MPSLSKLEEMRVQVIHAHPLPGSYSAALFRTAVSTLEDAGHEVVETDLYEEGFDPRLSPLEREAYYQPEPLRLPDVDPLIERLVWSEGLVFCFPHWWFDVPAILKGYFDRVLLPGIAFIPDPASGRVRPALRDLRKVAVITSFGSPWWLVELYMRNPTRRILRKGILAGCARRIVFRYLAHYDMDRSTLASRASFLRRVEREMRAF